MHSVRKIGTGNPGLGHQINRSIFVLVIINLGFWLTSLIGTIVIPALPFDNAVTKLFYVRLILQLPRLATLLNAPVLYFCSSEYRSAFRKEMRRFIGCPHQSTLSTNPNGVVNPGIVQQQHQRNANQQQQWQGGQRRQQQQPMINNMMMPITSSN